MSAMSACVKLHPSLTYCIVSGKHLWAFAAQALKIEVGWLHGGGAWMVQLSPYKHPPQMRSYLPGSTESTCIVVSLVLHWGQPNGVESCIVFESRPTHSLIAYATFVACSMRLWLGVCKTLLPEVMESETHQNDDSYVSLADLLLNSLCKNLAWWAATRRISKKPTKLSKLGGGRLCRDGRLPRY